MPSTAGIAGAAEAQGGCEERVTRSALDFARRGSSWAIMKADVDKERSAGLDGGAIDRLWLRLLLRQLACAISPADSSSRKAVPGLRRWPAPVRRSLEFN